MTSLRHNGSDGPDHHSDSEPGPRDGYLDAARDCILDIGWRRTTLTEVTRLSPSDAAKVDVVYVTTDPARDTEPVLERYLAHVHPGFIGLTGDLADITAIAKPLGVAVDQGAKLPSGGYDVTHGTTITGIDSRDQGTVYWSQETSSAQFAADIHTLLSEGN